MARYLSVSSARQIIEADPGSGYLGGTTANGQLVVRRVDDVRAVDHSELGVRNNRWRWAAGAPDTVMWTGEKDDMEDAVADWLAKRGISIGRHRHYPDGYNTWSARVSAARGVIETLTEARGDHVTLPDGSELRYHTGVPFIWLTRAQQREVTTSERWRAVGSKLFVGKIHETGFCTGGHGTTHADIYDALGLCPPKSYAREGRIWTNEGAVAFWGTQREVPRVWVTEVVERFPTFDVMNFALQFGDDSQFGRVERLVGDWLETGGDDAGTPEAEAATALGHAAHLLGARAAGQSTNGQGSARAAAVAGAEPVAAWRARNSTSEAAL